MSDLLRKSWRPLLLAAAALAFFLGAYFSHYRGGYDAPDAPEVALTKVTVPSSTFGVFAEAPSSREGLTVVDGAHRNDFVTQEITTLLSRVADRGYDVEFIGEVSLLGRFHSFGLGERLALLDERLRQADSLVVIVPTIAYFKEEADIIERFVKKGGKLLLIGDPGREHDINTLAKRFELTFQPDYLYNPVEYDLNFQNIFVHEFKPDEITNGLSRVVFYASGSIKSAGAGLAFTDENTRSSIAEGGRSFAPISKAADGHVLAIGDLTFMIPPQGTILDNDRLISNIADFLTTSDRSFGLGDFPYFFRSEVDVLMARSSLVDAATAVRRLLSGSQIPAEIRGVEDIGRNTVFLGLYEDARQVVQYLDVAGIQVGDTLRTTFTPDVTLDGSAVLALYRTKDRYVLVLLGHSEDTILSMVDRLTSGAFRNGLVNDFVGVYETP